MGIRNRINLTRKQPPQILGEVKPDEQYEEVTMLNGIGETTTYLVRTSQIEEALVDNQAFLSQDLFSGELAREMAKKRIAMRYLGKKALGLAQELKQI
jgi:hypothetical protein